MSKNVNVNIWDIRRSVVSRLGHLSSLPHISHLSIGEKLRQGKRTGERSIIAYVSDKKREIESEHCFPTHINCYKKNGDFSGIVQSDVQQVTSKAAVFGLRAGHIIRGFDGDLGVCALTYSNSSGQQRLMTNAHVVIDVSNNGASNTPAFYNRVDSQFYQLGEIKAVSNLRPNQTTTHDVAVIDIPQGYDVNEFMVQDIANDIDEISGISTLSNDRFWYVVNGEIMECDSPERIIGFIPIVVDGTVVHYSECWQFRMTKGNATPGQSGALICRTSGTNVIACGLIFGGIEPTHIFAFPFNKIWNKFKKF